MMHIRTLSATARKAVDGCKRCQLYGESFHMRDTIWTRVRAAGTFSMADIIAPDQLASLARWANERDKQTKRNRRGMMMVGGRVR